MEEAFIRKALEAGWTTDNDAERRLARRIPWLVSELDSRVSDGIERALLGLDDSAKRGDSLTDRIRLAVARSDGGERGEAFALSELEEEAQATEDPALWIPAARLHARVNVGREASARMSLSDQTLPYVFPGDLHPLMVDVLACGDRVLPALHVDWLRKLTGWLVPAMAIDCGCLGMWFWPILTVLDAKKLNRELQSMNKKPQPPGARGLAAVYAAQLGLALDPGTDATDRRVLALAVLGNSND
jgi:hypothetical protein